MALVIRVKRDVVVDGVAELPIPTQGTVRGVVRLWYEQPSPPAAPGIPMTRSPLSLVIGDDIGPTSGTPSQRYGESFRAGEFPTNRKGWETLLNERGLSLADYVGARTFVADLAVPATVIDSYVG